MSVENIRLSKNIFLYDYLKSATAERNPAIRDLQYNPAQELIDNAARFATMIDQPLIDMWGATALTGESRTLNKTSTYRCDKLNTLIGGAAGSYHTFLLAGDREPLINGFEGGGKYYKELAMLVVNNLPFDKCILEFGSDNCPAWLHVQLNKEGVLPRKQVFRIGNFTGGKYVLFDLNNWNPI